MADAIKSKNEQFRNSLTRERLWELLDYDPETGVFTWKRRPVYPITARTDNSWNSQHAGKAAGHVIDRGYICISMMGVVFRAHRIAFKMMTGRWPDPECDHRDLNTDNNKWINLREATKSQNSSNRPISPYNKARLKGVSWHKGEERWRAVINVKNEVKHLGYFETAEDAYEAYCAASQKYHGEFGRVE